MLNWQKHKIKMLQILKEVYADVSIAAHLGFKEGTACYFFYDLPRYSVDLDFDLLDIEKKEFVFEKMVEILEKFGIVKDNQIKRNTIFLLLSYGEEEHNIKIEISTRDLKNDFEVKNYFGLPIFVMKRKDMFANKLVALCSRNQTASRDIFDIHFFFKNNWEINEKIIKHWTQKKIREYFVDCVRAIEAVPDNKILQGIGELVDEKQKSWIKRELRQEVLMYMKMIINDKFEY